MLNYIIKLCMTETLRGMVLPNRAVLKLSTRRE
jgi:hypothetical protein